MRGSVRRVTALFATIAALVLLAAVGSAQAATYTVTKTADTADGTCNSLDCSLREAVIAANDEVASPGLDLIVVPNGTYTLTLTGTEDFDALNAAVGDLDVTADTTIQGTSEAGTIIQGHAQPNTAADRVLDISGASSDVSVTNLTVRNGRAPSAFAKDNGGNVRNGAPDAPSTLPAGHLTMTHVTISGGHADCAGGGLMNSGGAAELTDSTLTGNGASGSCGGGLGGAIYNVAGASVTLTRTSLSANSAGSGGGLINLGTATVSDSTVASNTAVAGAGIANRGGTGPANSTLTITGSTFSGNQANGDAAGAVDQWSSQPVTISNSTFKDNHTTVEGGAIRKVDGPISVTNSTFTGNDANYGGAIANGNGGIGSSSKVTLRNDTFSGNTANTAGGALRQVNGSTELTHVTIAGNTAPTDAGGAISYFAGSVTAANTIIGANTGGNCAGGGITSQGHNIDSENSCGFAASGDQVSTNPKLGALTGNGGPTFTRALAADSPAIDAADTSFCSAALGTDKDQRGVTRPVDGDDNGSVLCDIGAFEYEPPADTDDDDVPDSIDNCPTIPNGPNDDDNQTNSDGDSLGDACDDNDDADTKLDVNDNCRTVANEDQANHDSDALGDACDTDDDDDGVDDDEPDNCPINANANQANHDDDGSGDACDTDDDNDTILDDAPDNCPTVSNDDQTNTDSDSEGDACDVDDDNDTVLDDHPDNCPVDDNVDQANHDNDSDGDACDANDDNDALPDSGDTCPTQPASTANGCPAQQSSDPDGDKLIGAADHCPDDAGPKSNNGCPAGTFEYHTFSLSSKPVKGMENYLPGQGTCKPTCQVARSQQAVEHFASKNNLTIAWDDEPVGKQTATKLAKQYKLSDAQLKPGAILKQTPAPGAKLRSTISQPQVVSFTYYDPAEDLSDHKCSYKSIASMLNTKLWYDRNEGGTRIAGGLTLLNRQKCKFRTELKTKDVEVGLVKKAKYVSDKEGRRIEVEVWLPKQQDLGLIFYDPIRSRKVDHSPALSFDAKDWSLTAGGSHTDNALAIQIVQMPRNTSLPRNPRPAPRARVDLFNPDGKLLVTRHADKRGILRLDIDGSQSGTDSIVATREGENGLTLEGHASFKFKNRDGAPFITTNGRVMVQEHGEYVQVASPPKDSKKALKSYQGAVAGMEASLEGIIAHLNAASTGGKNVVARVLTQQDVDSFLSAKLASQKTGQLSGGNAPAPVIPSSVLVAISRSQVGEVPAPRPDPGKGGQLAFDPATGLAIGDGGTVVNLNGSNVLNLNGSNVLNLNGSNVLNLNGANILADAGLLQVPAKILTEAGAG